MIINKNIHTLLILLFLMIINSQNIYSHAPHDDISDMIRINLPEGHKIITIVRSNLLCSTNGNDFTRIVNGLDNTCYLNRLACSPIEQGHIYLSTEGDGVYFSNNFGQTWQKRNNGLNNLNIKLLEISPSLPELIFAAGSDSGLFISNNSGEKWQQVQTYGSNITTINFIPDQVIISDNTGKIFSFNKSNLSLKLIYTLPSEYGQILTMAVSPLFSKTGEILLGTETGLLSVTIKPKTTIIKFEELPSKRVSSIKYSKNYLTDATLYALFGYDGFFITTNKGKKWQKSCKGLSTDNQAIEYNLSHFNSMKVFSSEDRELIYICGFDGLFTKESKEEKWLQLNTLSEDLIVGLAVSENYNTDSTIAYLTYLKGPVISSFKGDKWESLFKNGLTLENLKSQGLVRLHDLIFCADIPGSLISISASNLYQYDRNNESWTNRYLAGNKSKLAKKIYSGLFRHDINFISESTYIVEKIKNSKELLIITRYGKVYQYSKETGKNSFIAGIDYIMTSVSVSPDYISDSTIFIGTEDEGLFEIKGKKITRIGFQGEKHILVLASSQFGNDSTLFVGSNSGFYKSENDGQTWTLLKVDELHDHAPVYSIAISPIYTSDSTLLIALKGFGLYKTENGGKSFRVVAKELIENNYSLTPIDFYPANSGSIKFSPTFRYDSTVFAYCGSLVFRSHNRGDSWIKLPEYNFNVKKDFLMVCRGVIFEFRYDIILLSFVFIGLVLVFYFVKYFKLFKIKRI